MAAITTGLALAIAGTAAAAGGVASSVIGSKAATKAGEQQAAGQQSAIDEQRRQFEIAQGNSKPFIEAGQQSIGQIMEALKSGKFGLGSTGEFKAPTLEEVQQTPGWQFALQQGNKGILQASAATGGAISGGTSKALQTFGTNLGSSTYNDAFQRAMATYGTKLAAQGQEFSQLLAPAQIGSGSTAQLNQTGSTTSTNISQLMAGIGSSKAAGTLGSANSVTGGINSATSGITEAMLLAKLLGKTSTGDGIASNG